MPSATKPRARGRRASLQTEWVRFKDGAATERPVMLCERCGSETPLELPLDVKAFCRKMQGFTLLHADCKEALSE